MWRELHYTRGTPLKLHTILAALALAGCQASDSIPQPVVEPTPTGDGVTLRIATPERIAGSYVDSAGGGLEFETARSGDDDLYLHLATRSGREILHIETIGDTYVFQYMDKRLTLEVSKAWIDQVRAEGAEGPAAQDESQLKWIGDKSVLDEMNAAPEMKSLPHLSRALGAAGYTGNKFPVVLPLHRLARGTADSLGITVEPLALEAGEAGLCTTYPNRSNGCYGMCGPSCYCWSWVCGDCCYHWGCAVHDSWCRGGNLALCVNGGVLLAVKLYGC